MTHTDEAMLDVFRFKRRCEFCCKQVTRCDPHHVRAKGMGAGARLDVAINLIGLCRYCHTLTETGKISKTQILEIVADREGVSVEWIEDRIHVLLRTPAWWGWTVEDILAGATPEGQK